jgi:acetate---CoA ligase (ADP-forming) subunit beta
MMMHVKPENSLQRILLETEAKEILQSKGIPTTAFKEAASTKEALQAAKEIGYPVVLKALSRQVIHKTDVGGVILDLHTPEQVEKSYQQIMDQVKSIDPKGKVIVQEMVSPGVEVIIGVTTDPQFGPVIMIGIGGIFTELLEDTAFGLIPITRDDGWRMLRSLRGFPLLEGYRGQEKGDLESIVEILIEVSKLVCERKDILEIDLNPVIIGSKGSVVVDARFVLGNGR